MRISIRFGPRWPRRSSQVATHRCNGVFDRLLPNDPLGPHRIRSGKRCSDKGFLAMADTDYLEILDWLARNVAAGKRCSTPEFGPPIFESLGIDAVHWSKTVCDFGRLLKNVAGKAKNTEETRSLKTHRKFIAPESKASRQPPEILLRPI
jgi:hypothetical protein